MDNVGTNWFFFFSFFVIVLFLFRTNWFIITSSKSPTSSKRQLNTALSRLYQRLSRRYAQKGYTGYAKHKGSLSPRDNGENQKNRLPRGLLYCDANHHVRKKIACLSRWRVRIEKWTNNMNVWFIHGYASPSLLVAATSSIPLSSIILVEHHYQQLLLLLTTITNNNDQQQQPTTTTIALSIIVYNNFMMMDHGRLLRITNAEGS